MMRGRVGGLLVFFLGAIGCGSGSQNDPNNPSSAPPGRQPQAKECVVATGGPLIGQTFQPSPQPLAVGGALVDGDYDLVQIVNYGSPAERNNNDTPSVRAVMRFTTTERSSNHTQGTMSVRFDMPPVSSCANGQFATIQTELRGIDGDGKLTSVPYSVVAPGQLFLQVERKTIWVFRRR